LVLRRRLCGAGTLPTRGEGKPLLQAFLERGVDRRELRLLEIPLALLLAVLVYPDARIGARDSVPVPLGVGEQRG